MVITTATVVVVVVVVIIIIIIINSEGCSSTSQVLGLLPKDHQFESHKSRDHWKLTLSLTSGPMGLVKIRASWPGHPR
jgi:hypothetical protein